MLHDLQISRSHGSKNGRVITLVIMLEIYHGLVLSDVIFHQVTNGGLGLRFNRVEKWAFPVKSVLVDIYSLFNEQLDLA